jgi:hypothetical protein
MSVCDRDDTSVVKDSELIEEYLSDSDIECGQKFSVSNFSFAQSDTSKDLFEATIIENPEFIPLDTSTPVKAKVPLSRKRKLRSSPETSEPVTKLIKGPTTEAPTKMEAALKSLPFIKEISILGFLSDYDSDPLVREYVDSVLALEGFCPKIPPLETMETYLDFPAIEQLPAEVAVSVIQNFMSYFQLNYFRHNVGSATANNVTLFNPKCDFYIPQFQLVPQQTLNKIHDSKKDFVIFVQDHALDGAEFTKELLLIRSVKLMKQHFKTKLEHTEDVKEHVKASFASFYIKARMEFQKVFNVKNIDWEKREGKLKLTTPYWRKSDPHNPPTDAYNKYAVDIVSRILDGKESFDGNSVKLAYANSKVKSAEAVSHRSSQFPGKLTAQRDTTKPPEPQKDYNRPTLGSRARGRGSFRGRGGSRGRGVPAFVPYRGGRSRGGARASRGQGLNLNHSNETQNIPLSSIFE